MCMNNNEGIGSLATDTFAIEGDMKILVGFR